MFYRKHSEILEEKRGKAQEKLKDAKPIVVISLKEGILIFTANPDLKFDKIYEVFDRIACAISGYRPDFMELYRPLVFGAEKWAGDWSEDDVALKDLADELAKFLKQRYENPGVPTPYIVNLALAEVAPNQKDDVLVHIDFQGDLRNSDSYLILNGTEEEKSEAEKLIQKYLKEGYSIEKICSDIAKQNKKLHQDDEGRLEAVFLSREKVAEKKFDDVFQRLKLERK